MRHRCCGTEPGDISDATSLLLVEQRQTWTLPEW